VSVVKGLKLSSFSDEEIADLFAPLMTLPSLAVAVSGGPDSMALMVMLMAWRSIVGENAPEISVLSVDHGLRPESADEVAFVARMAREYGLNHQAFSWDGSKSEGNISSQSRTARYELMCDWCEQHQISHLLVAHTLDDQAETVLLRLARGSGVDGLSAMATSRTWNTTLIYRPLLGVKRSRLLELLEEVNCAYVSDPSNHDLKYDRVRFRQAMEILEPLGITAQGLAETASRQAHARQALDVMTVQAIAQSVMLNDAGFCILSPQKLEPFPYEIKRRVLGRLLRTITGRDYVPEQSSLDLLLSWLSLREKPNRTLGGCYLMSRQQDIWLMRETGRDELPEVLLHPGQRVLWDNRFEVSLSAFAENPLLVKALGVENYTRIKSAQAKNISYPSALGSGLPSFWHDHVLVSVPHLNFSDTDYLFQIEAVFANSMQLTEV